ncbi:uncharacterized protein [Epargyreus clarus]|uniref:uncharacterized protein isoform X2 n=1 Tax=Epargyreus clarus TaxID=520877 RepID=UPI003C2B69DE
MPKLIFDDCCFCVELRTGCLIIGYLNLIGSIIATIMSIMLVATGSAIVSVYHDDPDVKTAGVVLLVVAIITLVIVGLLLAFAIVLLIGLHKDKPGHVKCYLIYSVIFLVLSFILFIVDAATNASAGDIATRVVGLALPGVAHLWPSSGRY